MADQQDESQEKTEEPTARRLSKAREEGQIARSTEITIAASVISVAIYIYLFGSSLLGNVANIFAQGLVCLTRLPYWSRRLLPAVWLMP